MQLQQMNNATGASVPSVAAAAAPTPTAQAFAGPGADDMQDVTEDDDEMKEMMEFIRKDKKLPGQVLGKIRAEGAKLGKKTSRAECLSRFRRQDREPDRQACRRSCSGRLEALQNEGRGSAS
jgi:hypothetical protein